MRKMVLLFPLFVLLVMAGCGGGGGGGDSGVQSGKLQVALTDAPAPAVAQIHLVVDKVVVVPAGRDDAGDNDSGLPVVATFPGGKEIDNVLDFHFIPQLLGDAATIPAGSYNQVRLILAPNSPTLNNYVVLTSNPNHKIPLTTPSAQESGLKILGKFTVAPGVLNTVLLDFDPNTAIVIRGSSGQINFKPTAIRVIQVFNSLANAGSVTGAIRSPLFRPWSSAAVSVVPRNPASGAVSSGQIFSNFSSPSVWKGRFTAFLPPNGSAAVPAASYKVFVHAFRDTAQHRPIFTIYSSPLFTVTTGVDTPVPPDGEVLLVP